MKPYLAVLPFVLIYSTAHKVWPLMNDELSALDSQHSAFVLAESDG